MLPAAPWYVSRLAPPSEYIWELVLHIVLRRRKRFATVASSQVLDKLVVECDLKQLISKSQLSGHLHGNLATKDLTSINSIGVSGLYLIPVAGDLISWSRRE